jgi:hypothetical protein
VALNQKVNIYFSLKRGIIIINYVQGFLCITKLYQYLRGYGKR